MSKSKQNSDQASMIMQNKRETMGFVETAANQNVHRSFVNAGAPSHGVTEGPDGTQSSNGMIKKEDVCGYAYKGYNPLAWKY